MTKKKLSDLLRQEAQKSLDETSQAETPQADKHQVTGNQVPEPVANPAASSPKTSSRKRSPKATQASLPTDSAADDPEATNSLETEATVSSAEEPHPESVDPIASTIASEPSHTSELQDLQETATAEIAELKGAIADLDTALKTAYQTETSLQQDLKELASALQQQREQVQTLTAELEQADRYKAELEQTKQLILTLSENNIKITQELDTLKRQSTASNTRSNIQVSKYRSSDRPSSSPSSSNYGLVGHGLANTELRKILEHPVQKEQSSTAFSDAEIGWVD